MQKCIHNQVEDSPAKTMAQRVIDGISYSYEDTAYRTLQSPDVPVNCYAKGFAEMLKEQKQEDDRSPLRRALRSHFELYSGLVEPRLEIADVTLGRPQQDDL
jgi:hypothetical protein